MGWLRATTLSVPSRIGGELLFISLFFLETTGVFISPELWWMIFGHSSKMMVFCFLPPPYLRLSLALDWNFLSDVRFHT